MTPLPETGRQAAHTLIDVVSLCDDNPNTQLMNRAFARLSDLGAIRARVPAHEPAQVDLSRLMGGTVVAMKWRVSQPAAERGVDESEVLAGLREFIDA